MIAKITVLVIGCLEVLEIKSDEVARRSNNFPSAVLVVWIIVWVVGTVNGSF